MFQITILMKKIIAFSLLLNLLQTVGFSQTNSTKTIQVCLTDNEMELYRLINDYRQQNNLPIIPISTSLCFVAQQHAKDVCVNKPDINGCNMHSWSNKGNWSPVCYTRDHKQAKGMWSKPRELTNYLSNGYEIAHSTWHSDDADYIVTAAQSLEGWKNSNGHNQVILNQGIWKNIPWNAIGIGIYKGYAMVWFGAETDSEVIPLLCK